MGFLDKVMFWKKKDEFPDLGKGADFGLDTGMGKGYDMGSGAGFGPQDNLGLGNSELGLPGSLHQGNEFGGFEQNAPFGAQAQPRYQPQYQPQTAPPGFQAAQPMPTRPQQFSQQEFTMVSKDIELLSYKLDTLKAAIDMANQRLANIERLATGETQRRTW